MSEEERRSEEEKRPISIRGVDRRLYEEMVVLARDLGKTIGELLNDAMALFLTFKEGAKEIKGAVAEGLEKVKPVVISNVEELVLNADDLREVKGVLLIRNVKKLEFGDDVTQALFDEKVKRIIKVDELIIPKSLSKIRVLAKSLFVKLVKIKE